MKVRRRTKLTIKWTIALIAAGFYFLRDVAPAFLVLFWIAAAAFVLVALTIDRIFPDADTDSGADFRPGPPGRLPTPERHAICAKSPGVRIAPARLIRSPNIPR